MAVSPVMLTSRLGVPSNGTYGRVRAWQGSSLAVVLSGSTG